MAHTEQHLHQLIDALVAAGGRFRPVPSEAGPFRRTQGGAVCYLEQPIDFAVARAVPG
jgi:hypothetical protein